MSAAKFLLKCAMASKLKFVMERPFSDRTPNEFTPDDAATLNKVYTGLAPNRQRIVDARRFKRERVHS